MPRDPGFRARYESVPRGLDGFPLANASLVDGVTRLAVQRFIRQYIGTKPEPPAFDWRPTPPSESQFAQAQRRGTLSESQPPEELLFVILTGGSAERSIKLLHNSSLSDCCVLPGIACLVYTDTITADVRVPTGMSLVPHSAYMHDPALPPPKTRSQCCRHGNGAFFCDRHRAATLTSQYRFLPALAHARRVHAHDWASGRFSWLVMVDDDAIVNHAALRQVLGGLDPNASVYLGDFGEWTHALAAPKTPRDANVPASDKRWDPPYACGGAGTVFSRAAVRQTDFFTCAVRYHDGCYQSDWMIGRCAALAGIMPMARIAESCGLCVMCDKQAHMQRRRALKRLRDDTTPPCFALTTCEHHLPEPLLYELCHLLPRRTPIMHGWHQMCGGILSGPAWPSLVRRFVSAPAPVTRAFEYLRLPSDTRDGLIHRLGVVQLEDLLDLLPEDLSGIGMSPTASARFMSAVWDQSPRHSMVRPAVNNATPLGEVLDGMRLQGWGRKLKSLGASAASDLRALTEADLRRIEMSLVQRRRIAAIVSHISAPAADATFGTAKEHSLDQLLKELRGNVAQVLTGQSGNTDECDCAWTGGPSCKGHKDDGTKCWAVCCPNRGPRFGVWQRDVGGLKRKQKLRRGRRRERGS